MESSKWVLQSRSGSLDVSSPEDTMLQPGLRQVFLRQRGMQLGTQAGARPGRGADLLGKGFTAQPARGAVVKRSHLFSTPEAALSKAGCKQTHKFSI